MVIVVALEMDAGWLYSWGYANGHQSYFDVWLGGYQSGTQIMSVPLNFNRTQVG